MAMKQYMRLLLVAVVPLILMGVFVEESELVFETRYLIRCQDVKSNYSCVAYSVGKEEYSREYFESILKFNGALLSEPIFEEFFVYSIDEKIVERKLIVIPPAGLRLNSPYGSCSIDSYRKGNRYIASCSGDMSFDFEFVNAGAAEKFKALENEILRLKERSEKFSMRASVASLLLPLAIFLTTSLVVFVCARLYKFVKGND